MCTPSHHLICQNAVQPRVSQPDHPPQALHLVVAQLAAGQQHRLVLNVGCEALRKLAPCAGGAATAGAAASGITAARATLK